jgi:hypothetical protein
MWLSGGRQAAVQILTPKRLLKVQGYRKAIAQFDELAPPARLKVGRCFVFRLQTAKRGLQNCGHNLQSQISTLQLFVL